MHKNFKYKALLSLKPVQKKYVYITGNVLKPNALKFQYQRYFP